jgi:hypothetical protein
MGRTETAMRFVTVAPVLVLLTWLSIAVPPEAHSKTVPQDPALAEGVFREAISAWAYGEHWRLYAMGSEESRAALSEKDFVEQMRRGMRKPGVGLEILDVRIAGVHALVEAKVRMDYSRSPTYATSQPPFPSSSDETIQIMLVYQDGNWRINVHQFVGMSNY